MQMACQMRDCLEMEYIENDETPDGWYLLHGRYFCPDHKGPLQVALQEKQFVIEVVPGERRRHLRAVGAGDLKAFFASICK